MRPTLTQTRDSIRFCCKEAIVAAFDRVLILETSGRIGQAALASGDRVVAEERLTEAHRRASDLALVVDGLFKHAAWKARDLTDVVVGLGPGSYTGLRVGLASAKALAYAVGCRFYGVESFAAIALRTPDEFSEVSVIADALQGKLFRRDYRRASGGIWEPLGPLQIVTRDDWLSELGPKMVASGPAATMFDVPRVADAEPRPIDLLTVARTSPWAVTTDVWLAEPLYLRGSSAEEKAASSK